jgi:hypothetical protein
MGLMKVRGCCLFAWRELGYGIGQRIIEVDSTHCAACIASLRALNPPVKLVDSHAVAKAIEELADVADVPGDPTH